MAESLSTSVVVASFSGEAALKRCLGSLRTGAAQAEVIVATNLRGETIARLKPQFPAVRFLPSAEQSNVFELRSLGLAQARGQLIGLIEDHCTVSPDWLNVLRAAYRAGHGAFGGPIDNGRTQTVYDWALYFCEYSAYMGPLRGGPTRALLGANAAYSREVLWSCYPIWQEAFYENEVHDALRAAGHRLYLIEKASVHSHLLMPFRAALAHLFSGGRRFGRYRVKHSSHAYRILWALAAPAVPLVLLGRIFQSVATRRPRQLKTFLLGLPYCLCLLLAWSTGELEGYLSRMLGYRIPEPPRRACYANRH